jgi:hypothetical protein
VAAAALVILAILIPVQAGALATVFRVTKGSLAQRSTVRLLTTLAALLKQ